MLFRSTSHIEFANTKPSTGAITTAALYQPGSSSTIVCSGDFKASRFLYTAGYLYGWNRDTNTTYDYSISLGTNGGLLMYTSASRLKWDSTGVTIFKPVSQTTNAGGFTINGSESAGRWDEVDQITLDGKTGKLLTVYHNANQTDAVKIGRAHV